MKLAEVLEALVQEIPKRATWKVAILTCRGSDGSMNEQVLEYPVFDISVDTDEAEINLLTDEGAAAPRPPGEGLTVEQLLSRLEPLRRSHCGFSVFSSTAVVQLDEEYEARRDVPLIGIAWNSGDKFFGLLQWPPEQWNGTD